MKITELTVAQLQKKLKEREISSRELTSLYYENVESQDAEIGAYLTLTRERAFDRAAEADRIIASGGGGALTGIPYGMKDNICTKGVRTTCASKMLENFIPPYDAFVAERLNGEGGVMLGKLNMDEFAMGSTTENSAFKLTRNPRDTSRVPGGSSGGSAAAVAANEAAFCIGSDTGGSIRQPAAFCGVVGMKPTYGSVSRNGLIAFASSLDQIGPITKSVEDAAIVMNSLAAHDCKDSTSVDRDYGDFTGDIAVGVEGMKIALPKEYFSEGISDDVKAGVEEAAKQFEKMGAKLVETSLPTLKYALPAYYVISSAEASSNLSRFDGVRYGYRSENFSNLTELYRNSRGEGFGKEVKRRIMLGTFALSAGYYDAYYKKALQVRTLVKRDFNAIFKACDFILAPVAPTVAYKIGEKSSDPLEMYAGDICTVPVNIAGLPALSMPCGDNAEGLPIGMQLIGAPFCESMLLRAGFAYERERGIYHLSK